jgi:hypothetical protein
MKPKIIQFLAEKDDSGIWYISGRTKQSKTEPKQSDGTVYFRLFRPDNDHWKAAVKNFVNSAVQRCNDKISIGTISVEVLRIDFYYHVTIVSKDDNAKTILRCNPIWNKKDNSIYQVTKNSWFDWVEVNWESRNGN